MNYEPPTDAGVCPFDTLYDKTGSDCREIPSQLGFTRRRKP